MVWREVSAKERLNKEWKRQQQTFCAPGSFASCLLAGLACSKAAEGHRQARYHICAVAVHPVQLRRKRLNQLKVGEKLKGRVVHVAATHAVVDVGAECDAVLHASKMAQADQIPGRVVEGMEVDVWVSGKKSAGYGLADGTTWRIDAKLEVTMLHPKDLSADVSEFLNLPADALLAATVSRIEDYGIFVMVRPPSGAVPVQGFVHVSEMKEGFVEHPANEVEIGQELTVSLLRVDRKFGRLRLSMKLPEVEGY
ncbi:unnamed protein product [Durusdinium trenchii]|uniref:S1 motif domain-containing protein n=1 Tax=Durusdinium trenchii TaxID=1381693 RepID=A0ABP0QM10_9DINO